jgi:hypothetical protein
MNFGKRKWKRFDNPYLLRRFVYGLRSNPRKQFQVCKCHSRPSLKTGLSLVLTNSRKHYELRLYESCASLKTQLTFDRNCVVKIVRMKIYWTSGSYLSHFRPFWFHDLILVPVPMCMDVLDWFIFMVASDASFPHLIHRAILWQFVRLVYYFCDVTSGVHRILSKIQIHLAVDFRNIFY